MLAIFKYLVLSATLSLLAACSTHPRNKTPTETDPKAAALQSIFDQYVTETGPGLAYAIVHHGETVASGGVGLANIEHNIPVDENSVFDIASVSKQFTAFAVLLLRDAGRLSLEDSIDAYLPELPDFGHEIKVRHLLYHTSGLKEWLELTLLSGVGFGDTLTKEQVWDVLLKQDRLNFVPGTKFEYSNTGYFLLGKIVEKIADKPFSAWMRDKIFEPLGMHSTHIHDDPTIIVPRRATGYFEGQSEGYRMQNHGAGVPGGSAVFTTARDMSQWMANFSQPKVGTAELLAFMDQPGRLDDGTPIDYAAGVELEARAGWYQVSLHYGRWPMFNAVLYRFPEADLTVCLLANSNHVDFWDLAYTKVAPLFEVPRVAESSELAEGEANLTPFSAEQQAMLPGKYWHSDTRRIITIGSNGDGLFLQPHNSWQMSLKRISGNRLRIMDKDTDNLVEFSARDKTISLRENGDLRIYRQLRTDVLHDAETVSKFTGQYFNRELGIHYSIGQDGDGLIARHSRNEDMPIQYNPEPNVFFTDNGLFRVIRFKLDPDGKIDGFLLDQWTNKDLWFEQLAPTRR